MIVVNLGTVTNLIFLLSPMDCSYTFSFCSLSLLLCIKNITYEILKRFWSSELSYFDPYLKWKENIFVLIFSSKKDFVFVGMVRKGGQLKENGKIVSLKLFVLHRKQVTYNFVIVRVVPVQLFIHCWYKQRTRKTNDWHWWNVDSSLFLIIIAMPYWTTIINCTISMHTDRK